MHSFENRGQKVLILVILAKTAKKANFDCFFIHKFNDKSFRTNKCHEFLTKLHGNLMSGFEYKGNKLPFWGPKLIFTKYSLFYKKLPTCAKKFSA